jgi:uncharacterized membrane protein YfcA
VTLAILAVIVLFSYATQAMTGFGSTVIALTLGAWLLPIPELLPICVGLNIPLCTWFVARHRAEIDRDLVIRGILPFMTVGVLAGVLLSPYIGGHWLQRGFGILVVTVAVRELVWMLLDKPPLKLPFYPLLVASGVVHGIYASGGPLLVLAMNNKELPRGVFRATLMAVWLVFNIVLLTSQLLHGVWDHAAVVRTLVLLPVIPVGIALGTFMHDRVPERAFKLVVQVALVVAGAALLK